MTEVSAERRKETELGVKTPAEDVTAGSRNASVLRQHLAAIAMSLGAAGMGCALGWSSAAFPLLPQCGPAAAGACYEEWQLSLVAGCASLGALAFALPAGWLADLLGRRRAALLLAPPSLAGWACLAWGDSLAWLCAGRVLTGAVGGAFNVVAPVYAAEVAQKRVRGALCGYFQLLLTAGTLYVYLLGTARDLFWASAGCALLPALSAAALCLVPESPRYLLRRGLLAEARAALCWLRGPRWDVDAELAETEAAAAAGAAPEAEAERRGRGGGALWRELRSAASRRAVATGLGLVTCFQLCGINVVLAFASDIFATAGVAALDAATASAVVGAMQVAATLAGAVAADRLGRRPLLAGSAAGVALGAALLAASQQVEGAGAGWLPLAGLCLFVAAFSLGLGPLTWLLLGELFAPALRAFAGSLCCLLNWALSLLVTTYYADLSAAVGVGGAFWIFAAVAAAGAFFVFFLVPETKDRSLEEIRERLSGGARVWSLSCCTSK